MRCSSEIWSPALALQVVGLAIVPSIPQAISGPVMDGTKLVVVPGFWSCRMQTPSPWDFPLIWSVVKRVCASTRDREARNMKRGELVFDLMLND